MVLNNISNKSVLIYGAGSIGCFLAAKLTKAGHSVDVVGRGKASGIGSTLYINNEPYDFPKVVEENNLKPYYNYVILTSKYYDLRNNLETLNKIGVKYDILVLIQNTFIDSLWYMNLIKNKPLCFVSVFEGFNLDGNKLIASYSEGWHIEDDLIGRDVSALLKSGGVDVYLAEDGRVKRAEKTLVNSVINILSVLYDATLKDIMTKKEIHSRAKAIHSEAYDVMVQIVPLKSKRALWENLYNKAKVGMHYTSSYQDVKRGKKTEISFINGFIVDMGKKMGIPTPQNTKAVKEFKEKYPNLY